MAINETSINDVIVKSMYADILKYAPRILLTIIILAVIIVLYKIIAGLTKKILLKHTKTKRLKSDVIIFMNLIKYSFYAILFIGVIFLATGSLTGFGISAGLFTAALGWALQRPITGIAAWIMVITKKPFSIGDRIMIGDQKGDVVDINLTHIHLNEIGGTVASEENSGRVIMIPNSIMFEQKIVNYTLQDEYILDEVSTLITYESNLGKAIKIAETAAKEVNKDIIKDTKKPYVRTYFADSGIKVNVRYYSDANNRVKRMSDITQEIFRDIKKAKDIEIAYPHTDIRLIKTGINK